MKFKLYLLQNILCVFKPRVYLISEQFLCPKSLPYTSDFYVIKSMYIEWKWTHTEVIEFYSTVESLFIKSIKMVKGEL
jgi:hypothetical protein